MKDQCPDDLYWAELNEANQLVNSLRNTKVRLASQVAQYHNPVMGEPGVLGEVFYGNIDAAYARSVSLKEEIQSLQTQLDDIAVKRTPSVRKQTLEQIKQNMAEVQAITKDD